MCFSGVGALCNTNATPLVDATSTNRTPAGAAVQRAAGRRTARNAGSAIRRSTGIRETDGKYQRSFQERVSRVHLLANREWHRQNFGGLQKNFNAAERLVCATEP